MLRLGVDFAWFFKKRNGKRTRHTRTCDRIVCLLRQLLSKAQAVFKLPLPPKGRDYSSAPLYPFLACYWCSVIDKLLLLWPCGSLQVPRDCESWARLPPSPFLPWVASVWTVMSTSVCQLWGLAFVLRHVLLFCVVFWLCPKMIRYRLFFAFSELFHPVWVLLFFNCTVQMRTLTFATIFVLLCLTYFSAAQCPQTDSDMVCGRDAFLKMLE